jgi:hypothetical protein
VRNLWAGLIARGAPPSPRRVKVEGTTAAVKEVGAQNFLATDLGQTGNPSPADGLQLFVTDLMKAGDFWSGVRLARDERIY